MLVLIALVGTLFLEGRFCSASDCVWLTLGCLFVSSCRVCARSGQAQAVGDLYGQGVDAHQGRRSSVCRQRVSVAIACQHPAMAVALAAAPSSGAFVCALSVYDCSARVVSISTRLRCACLRRVVRRTAALCFIFLVDTRLVCTHSRPERSVYQVDQPGGKGIEDMRFDGRHEPYFFLQRCELGCC